MPGTHPPEEIAKVSRSERAHGECLHRAAEQRSIRAERGAMHHVPARSADHQARPAFGTVEPVLQYRDHRPIGSNQVGKLVDDERSRPVRVCSARREAFQEGAPVRIFDIGKAGKPLRNSGSEVSPLDCGCRLIGDRIQTAAPPRPLDEQTRLADATTAPDHRKRARLPQRLIKAAQLVVTIYELHPIIMPTNIMLTSIISSQPQPAAPRCSTPGSERYRSRCPRSDVAGVIPFRSRGRLRSGRGSP